MGATNHTPYTIKMIPRLLLCSISFTNHHSISPLVPFAWLLPPFSVCRSCCLHSPVIRKSANSTIKVEVSYRLLKLIQIIESIHIIEITVWIRDLVWISLQLPMPYKVGGWVAPLLQAEAIIMLQYWWIIPVNSWDPRNAEILSCTWVFNMENWRLNIVEWYIL